MVSGDIVRVSNVVLKIFYFIILMIISGCDDVSSSISQPETWPGHYLKVVSECPSSSSSSDCQFLVTVGPFEDDKTILVKLHADSGVDFIHDEGHFQHEITDTERTSVVKGVHLQQYGTRIIHFPFTYDQQPQSLLAGEYIVTVQLIAVEANGELRIIDVARPKVFIRNDYTDDRVKNNSLMQGQSEFNTEYAHSYIVGENAKFLILLKSGVHPTEGSVLVRINGLHDDYDPVLTIHTDGGIEFENIDSLFLCIDKGGSRIINFPFRIIEGAYQPDGRYMLSLSIQEDGITGIHEILPTAIVLHSNANTHEDQWLETVSDIPTLHVATPAASHAGRADTGGGGSTGYSQTVSTGNHMSLEDSPQTFSDTGGIPMQCDFLADSISTLEDELNTDSKVYVDTVRTIIGGDPVMGNDPNANGGLPAVSVVNMVHTQADDHTSGNPNTDPACMNWQYPLTVDIGESNLLDIYLKYVKNKVIGMELTHFADGFWACNDIEENTTIVQAHKMYYLPDGSRP